MAKIKAKEAKRFTSGQQVYYLSLRDRLIHRAQVIHSEKYPLIRIYAETEKSLGNYSHILMNESQLFLTPEEVCDRLMTDSADNIIAEVQEGE